MKAAEHANSKSTTHAKFNISDRYKAYQDLAVSKRCFDNDVIDSKFITSLRNEIDSYSNQLITSLCNQRGVRYEQCEFNTYITNTPEKLDVVEKLKKYHANAEANLAGGNGVILFGPRGTGKDHLAMSLAKSMIRTQFTEIAWFNGMDIFGMFRDSFNEKSSITEQDVIRRLCKPRILYISDPLPPSGSLSEFQMSALFRVLDMRYSHCKATWITINVQDGTEMDLRLGMQNGDRLRDGSLAVFCNWPSFRKVAL